MWRYYFLTDSWYVRSHNIELFATFFFQFLKKDDSMFLNAPKQQRPSHAYLFLSNEFVGGSESIFDMCTHITNDRFPCQI